jgi:hypothetical protein
MAKILGKIIITLEVLAISIIIYGFVICYGSAFLVFLHDGHWPTFGKTEAYHSYLFENNSELWAEVYYSGENTSFFSVLIVWPYLLLRMPYLFFTKKSKNFMYIPIVLLVLSIFFIVDPLRVIDWIGQD